MMVRFRSLGLAVLLALAACGAALAAQDYIVVDARGEAAIVNGDTSAARNAAKRDLYRNAVEKAIGAVVHSATKMKDFEVLSDRVYSQAQGVVSGIDDVEEEVRGDIFVMSARCKVTTAALGGALGPALIDAMGNPRVVMLITAYFDGKPTGAIRAGDEVSKVFQKAGYLMLDSTQLAALNPEQLQAEVLRGNPQALRTLVTATGADVILSLTVNNAQYAAQRIEGVPIYAVQSSVQLKAISAQNAYVLAESQADHKGQGVSQRAAADKAMIAASKITADELAYNLAYSLVNGRSGGLAGRTVSVTVDAISFGQSRKLKAALEELSGVVSVFQRSFSNGTLQIDVVIDGSAEDVAVFLEDNGVEVRDMAQDVVNGLWRK